MKFFFALVGVALAVHSSWPQDRLFKSQTEYRFRFEGSLVSGLGLPQSDAAVTRHRCDVHLQLHDDKIAVVQIKNAEFALDNIVPTENFDIVPFERLEKQRLTEEHKTLIELPVRFHFRQGLITDLQFSPEDQTWSTNMKRAVINMLQLNWEKLNAEQESENQFFTVMEKNVEGECEVAYTRNTEPKRTMITKAINFEKCERRMELAYAQRYASECSECDQKIIVPQTVYTYKVEGKQLKEVELASVYTVPLKDKALMQTKVQARLVLQETSELRRQIQAPTGDKQDIVYSPEFDYAVEDYLKNGEDAKVNPMVTIPKKLETIEEFVNKLSEVEVGSVESADYFVKLGQYIRVCSEEDLRILDEKIYRKAEPKIQALIDHSLAVSGSKNTIQHALRHAKNLPTIKVVQLLKSIQETPFPSEKIADLLIKFSETERCRKDSVLQQTVWLAYGSIARGIAGSPLEKHAFPATKETKQSLVTVMKQQWEKADSVYEKVLAIKTFANAGIDMSVNILEKILSDKQQPTIVRREAIDALRLLAEQMPRKIHRVLMPIYANRLEKNEIRMAALNIIVKAQPGHSEISQIVLRMDREPNQHVAAFTYHMLTSLAESQLPVHRNISIICSNLLKSSLYRPESRILSIYKHASIFNEDTLSGMGINFGAIFGKDSTIPKDVMASLETVFGGHLNKYLAQVGFSHQNVEALYNKVISKLEKEQKKGSYSRASRLSVSVSALKELARKLNIRARPSTTEESYAMVYLRYKQMDYAVLPVDDQMIEEFIQKYIRDGKFDWKKLLEIEMPWDFEVSTAGFMLDSMVKISNSLGLPMVHYNKQPTVFGMNGKIEQQGLKLSIKAQPRFTTMHFHSMHIWIPAFTNGIKTLRTVEISTPIDLELQVSYKNGFELQVRQQMPEEKNTLVRLESRPICFVRYFTEGLERFYSIHEKTIVSPRLEKLTREVSKKVEVQGLEFEVTGTNYAVWDLETLLKGEQRLQISVIPTRRMPKQLVAKMSVEEMSRGRIEEPKIERMLQKMETEEGEWESRSESVRRDHVNKLVREMNLKNANKQQIVFSLQGNQKTEAVVRAEWEENFQLVRLSVDVKLEQRRDWNMESVIEMIRPRSVASVEELKQQKLREVVVLCETKWGSEEKNTIEIVAQLEQSKEQRNLIKEPKSLRGIPAHEQLSRLARLNQLKAKVNYKLTPEKEMLFEEIFNLIKGYTYWNSEVEVIRSQPRQLQFHVVSEPFMSGLFNMTVETPECRYLAKNVRVPVVPAFVLPTIVRQPKNVLRHSSFENAECKIEESRVQTFDNTVFRAPLSTCYTVVAKDCSELPRYSVLVRNTKKNGEEKMMKVMYENVEYEVEFVQGEPKIQVNGKQIRRETELEEYNIEKIGELCVIDLGELVVRFDGYTVKVLLNNGEMNTQCGLCGHFDGEKKNDYRTASDEETDDLEKFHRSYIVKTEECSYETSQKNYREYNQEETDSQEEDYDWNKRSFKRSDKKIDNSYDEEDQTETERKTLIKETSHKMCFSMEPVEQCRRGTLAEKTVSKKIRFACLPRHETEARRLLSALRRGESINVEGLEQSLVETVQVPRICVA